MAWQLEQSRLDSRRKSSGGSGQQSPNPMAQPNLSRSNGGRGRFRNYARCEFLQVSVVFHCLPVVNGSLPCWSSQSDWYSPKLTENDWKWLELIENDWNQMPEIDWEYGGERRIGQFYSALQKLNTPQTTKTAQIISFIERVQLPLDCILLERCGGTTFTDTAQVVLGILPTCARAVLTHILTSSVCPLLPCFPPILDGYVEMWPSESRNMRMRLLHVFHFQPRHEGNPVSTLLWSKETMWEFHDMATSPCNLMKLPIQIFYHSFISNSKGTRHWRKTDFWH